MNSYELNQRQGVYIAKCKKCGYVAISAISMLAEQLIKIHLRETHNIRA